MKLKTTLTIGVSQLKAAFSVDNANPEAGNSVQFTDQSKGAPTFWYWDFGDGNSSTSQNPTHTYQSPGTYSVKLVIAKKKFGDIEEKLEFIDVIDVVTVGFPYTMPFAFPN